MRILKIISIGLLLMLSSCASVSLQSTKDANFTNPIHKLFIVINHVQVDDIDPKFTPYLVKAILNDFSNENIETQLHLINPTALKGNNFLDEIEAYQPDGVMAIDTNGGVSDGAGGLMTIYYDVSIFDQSSKKRIWRARINASGGSAIHEKRMLKVVQEIIKRLKEDKIISPTPRELPSTKS